jgi:hypothetical protein
MKQKTSVEWLENELIKRFKRSKIHYTDSEWCFDMIKKLSKQAKELEKQQIIDAYRKGFNSDDIKLASDFVKNKGY